MRKIIVLACTISGPLLMSQITYAGYDFFKSDGNFKRFSVSAGWLHAMPQGKANNMKNSTVIVDGTTAENGSISKKEFLNAVDPDYPLENWKLGAINFFFPNDDSDLSSVSGTSTINGLQNWESANTGLEAKDVDTLGIMMNYHINDNWAVELKAGIPPKVDIMGKGQVYAPFSGTVKPDGIGTVLGDIKLKKDISITNLEQSDTAATARAWLPAAEIHYQFGKSGINKFRPYVGAGVLYAYFNDIKINSGIIKDLENAGHKIQNIKDGQAGGALEGRESSANMKVKVKTDDAFAPIVTLGATYDFNDKWFAVGSVSYAKLSNDTTITVKNENTGESLIKASTTIDIDPIITYAGLGYRF
ncbi:OmpW family protein [Acinetobacter puyangensis]|uniref:Outer membrane protein W n=1 Tax=Acinetobacter puyangensis TaxID=1096779 RepID=A0A240E6E6_9GAMM|nr:OmpW family outer membrane protein [Acinetobacter puyangensis]SNX44136.1 Outer membrane protein W [Acinetobacter puyangensis]